MTRKSGRTLNAQERALWEKVVENATPLEKRDRSGVEATAPKPKSSQPAKPKSSTRIPDDFRVGGTAKPLPPVRDLATPMPDALTGTPRMDRKVHGRMTKGKLEPEGRIDLHGMTLAAAHPALTRFILAAHGQGKRLVLVITGKGRDRDQGGPIPMRTGVLRHEVPMWLRSGLLASAVLDIAPAHRKHGGSGAYYVYLRRRR